VTSSLDDEGYKNHVRGLAESHTCCVRHNITLCNYCTLPKMPTFQVHHAHELRDPDNCPAAAGAITKTFTDLVDVDEEDVHVNFIQGLYFKGGSNVVCSQSNQIPYPCLLRPGLFWRKDGKGINLDVAVLSEAVDEIERWNNYRPAYRE
jgi:hypothetical protein